MRVNRNHVDNTDRPVRLGEFDPATGGGVSSGHRGERRSQYTRELLFSTTVELMSLVALGLRPSVHAAAKSMKELPVTVQALYGKLNHSEPEVVRKLVSGSAERLRPVVQELIKKEAATLKGYRLRIVDGNHLPASEKRLKPLRGFRGAALPGQSLVVYDPDLQLAVDVLPCEDAHTQERVLMRTILETAAKGDLWIGDRNFCTGGILCGFIEREAHFLIREHGRNPNPREWSRVRRVGRICTGMVYEQLVSLEDEHGVCHTLRRRPISPSNGTASWPCWEKHLEALRWRWWWFSFWRPACNASSRARWRSLPARRAPSPTTKPMA